MHSLCVLLIISLNFACKHRGEKYDYIQGSQITYNEVVMLQIVMPVKEKRQQRNHAKYSWYFIRYLCSAYLEKINNEEENW